MKVSQLVETLKFFMDKHGDGDVQISSLASSKDFDDLNGVSFCEEGNGVILCDKETFEAFLE